MASPKTRANMARVAAAAVFAAGASLAVVGTASADDPDSGSSAEISLRVNTIEGISEGQVAGVIGGGDQGAIGGGDQGAVGGDESEGAVGGDESEGAVGGDESEGAVGGDESDGGAADGGSPEGVAEGSTGPNPASQGANPIEQNDPTEQLTEAEAMPGGNGELAETGASMNEALLIIGAATMIAGGVAFRYLPRLITRNGGAAAA